ncbi:ABC transporter substrate-binding protein [Paenibacillus prosopidis]|uniref:Carbohydrate ABC transporter substrate-binding protein (CUT1 family) n=1 Tax=Paenibacillus prosopidis TaxID=630520 RepID=A0A368VRM5_9BACL|nr:ABC transporter substrate-binding protein [Paenibacillus prosopidis]RCW43512.1 carbohydrate ABC transporter substrate-binding protein (CUT1 family) [Paenibacillus prosopidis]
MRRKTKYFSLLLAAAVFISLLAACSSNTGNNEGNNSTAPTTNEENGGQATTSGDEATKDPYEITLAMPVFGSIPKDIEVVQAEINKISQAKINATVKILPISIGAWQQQMNLMMSGGEKLDLAFTFGQSYPSQVAMGQIEPIDELLSAYGEGIKQAIGTEYLKSAEVSGKHYGVPTLHDYAGQSGIIMRKDLLDKYKINIDSIKTLDDLDSVFKTIKENEPGMAPLAIGTGGPLDSYVTYDRLGDRFGVLPGFDNGLKIENYYESTEYADLLNRMHQWFKAGYINKDAATTQIPEIDMVKEDKAFSYFARNKPGYVSEQERGIGKEMVFVNLLPEAYSATSDVMVGMWTISQNSENQQRAMMFLNLMYTDKDIANLMLWGVEGKHYMKVTETSIDLPETTVDYATQSWLMANPFLTYTHVDTEPDVWTKMKAFNEEAVKSKALGFSFNAEPVKNEITALNNVVQQYRKILETGTIDPTKRLPEFIAKLKAAGIDKVIVEKQKQLDAWAAAKQ